MDDAEAEEKEEVEQEEDGTKVIWLVSLAWEDIKNRPMGNLLTKPPTLFSCSVAFKAPQKRGLPLGPATSCIIKFCATMKN